MRQWSSDRWPKRLSINNGNHFYTLQSFSSFFGLNAKRLKYQATNRNHFIEILKGNVRSSDATITSSANNRIVFDAIKSKILNYVHNAIIFLWLLYSAHCSEELRMNDKKKIDDLILVNKSYPLSRIQMIIISERHLHTLARTYWPFENNTKLLWMADRTCNKNKHQRPRRRAEK